MSDIDINIQVKRGENLVNRIDTLLTERNEKRQVLCDSVGITLQAITNWKKQNSLPTVETVIKIADYFRVDPKWLITGQLQLSDNYQATPSAIFERIYHMLLEETGIPNPDYQEVSLEQQGKIWAPVAEIVSCFDLYNWQFNRVIPSYFQIEKLAEHFHKPLSYIAEGIDDSIPNYVESLKVPKDEYDNYKNYEKYKTLFWSFNAMYEPDKKYISQLICRLFRLRRFAEDRDFDFDYNLAHPLEKPRQKDPNISDEDYATNNKQ